MTKLLFGKCKTLPVKFISIIVFFILFSGCLSIKPSSSKSGKNYFVTFFVGEEGTQYFIKPILLKNEKSSDYLKVDMTFRYKNEIKDSTTVNISIQSAIVYKTIDSLKLVNKDIEIKSTKIELLFNEKNKKGFISRQSTKFSLKETKELFNSDDWEMIVYNQNKVTSYKPHGKTSRAIHAVRDRVFVLM
jgi:hypothetical protein